MTGPQTGRGRNQKGSRAELAVVHWIRDWYGWAAERIRSGRSTDAGDITWPESCWVMDVKDQQRWSVLAWWRSLCAEAGIESTTTGKHLRPVLVLKVPGEADPARWIAVVRLQDLDLEPPPPPKKAERRDRP